MVFFRIFRDQGAVWKREYILSKQSGHRTREDVRIFPDPVCNFLFLSSEFSEKISLSGVVKTLSGSWQADLQKQGKAFFSGIDDT